MSSRLALVVATVLAGGAIRARPAVGQPSSPRIASSEPGGDEQDAPEATPLPAVVAPLPTDIPDPPPVPPSEEPSAAAIARAPIPGAESGRTDPVDNGDTTARAVGRGVLFVPRLVVDAALAPVRGGVYVWERYRIQDLYYRLFFNDARTIGLYPTVAFESGFGVTGLVGGARFVARDLFGEHEHLALQAAVGSSYYWRQLYSASFKSGNRLGKRFSVELDAGYEMRPRDTFYGIGNGDLVTTPGMAIDPRTDPTAVDTRYSQTRARLALVADAHPIDHVHVLASGSVSDRTFGPGSSGVSTDMIYESTGLVGWSGVRDAYGELELRWDDRGPGSVYEPTGMPALGTLAAVFGGRVHRLDSGADYSRYGADVAEFIRLAKGPRVLALRLHGEGVTGSVDEVPFSELPKLGGGSFLRGYALDRFRDRVAIFGSAEYQWDLSAGFAASLFSDVGRVYSALDAISADHLRLGYGLGFIYHGGRALRMETSVGSSLDGGLFFNLAFNPVYTLDERVRRR